jgi:hypothetical protein
MREREHLEGPRIDGKIILRHLEELVWGGMIWIGLA